MEAIIVIAVIFGFIGLMIGRSKGRPLAGLLLGGLLGLIGVIVISVMKPTTEFEAKHKLEVDEAARALAGSELRACPWCAEKIQTAAKVCRYCGRDVGVETTPDTASTASS